MEPWIDYLSLYAYRLETDRRKTVTFKQLPESPLTPRISITLPSCGPRA